jgi:hypothetical protein
MANLSFIAPSASVVALDGSAGYYLVSGRDGLFAPPTRPIEQDIPLSPGAVLKYLKLDPREVQLYVLIKSSGEAALEQARRSLINQLNPTRGTGTLRYVGEDATTRDLFCICVDGLSGVESEQSRGPGWHLFSLRFRALDPFWYDALATVSTFSQGAAVAFFGNPWLGNPWRISSSGVLSSFAVNNDGDVEAWPVWTITGPGTNPILTNSTTSKSISCTITLTAGQSLIINTSPGVKTILRENNTSQFSTLSATSELWPLVRGANTVALTMSGTTSASSIQLQYKRRWLGV